MIFHSLEFAVFLIVAFALHWALCRGRMAQNLLILVASYVFYGWWDARFLILIVASSATDFIIGHSLAGCERPAARKWLLGVSLLVNLGLLATFKYLGFFVDSFAALLDGLGFDANVATLELILPVGISFYTFQTLSYTIDIYHRRAWPTRDPIAFFAFVSFFPQLVAGPIERSSHLLPQFLGPRKFDAGEATAGLRLLLLGLGKKILVADSCAPLVDQAFASPHDGHGWSMALALMFFSFQIYGDFSGYSDMARGIARLFGISLMRNFDMPYFAASIVDFWRRWHISLSTWFRDYVYFPLGGSRRGTVVTSRNLLIVFLVSGLWHGANWTFVFWGLMHGILMVFYTLMARRFKPRRPRRGGSEVLSSAIGMVVTFCLVTLAWTFFRAPDLGSAVQYLWRMATDMALHPGGGVIAVKQALLQSPAPWFIGALVAGEGLHRAGSFRIEQLPVILRWMAYLVAALAILYFHLERFHVREFIYFQF